jgi:hypothetical protein
VKKLPISKVSDFSSASLSVGDGYLQIDLEPHHRKLIIRARELGKITRVHCSLILSGTQLFLQSLFERFFRRGRWLGRQYYELGSLMNLYLRAREAAASGNALPFELLQERMERVLRYYRLKALRRYRSLFLPFRPTSHEYLEAFGVFLHHELVHVLARYQRRRILRGLLRAARKAL